MQLGNVVELVEDRIAAQAELTFEELVPVASTVFGNIPSQFLVTQLQAPRDEHSLLSRSDRLALLVIATFTALSEPIVGALRSFLVTVEEIDLGDVVASVVVQLCRDKIAALA